MASSARDLGKDKSSLRNSRQWRSLQELDTELVSTKWTHRLNAGTFELYLLLAPPTSGVAGPPYRLRIRGKACQSGSRGERREVHEADVDEALP